MVCSDQEHFSKGGWGGPRDINLPVYRMYSVSLMIIILIFHYLYYNIHVYVINSKIFKGIIQKYFNMYMYWRVFCIRCWTLWDWLLTIPPPPPRKSIVLCRNYDFMFRLKIYLFQSFSLYITCYIYILAFIKIRDSFGSLWSDESWCWWTLIIR